LKFYPLVAFPALFVSEQVERAGRKPTYETREARLADPWWWRAALFGSVVLVAIVCLATSGLQDSILQPITYFIQRPPQIESMQGSIAWLAHLIGGPLQVANTYGSVNIVSPLSVGIGWVNTSLCIAGCLYVFWLQWRRQLTLGQAMIALLCTLLMTGKVFSPQYLIWLNPSSPMSALRAHGCRVGWGFRSSQWACTRCTIRSLTIRRQQRGFCQHCRAFSRR
jgi:hypothetical protein